MSRQVIPARMLPLVSSARRPQGRSCLSRLVQEHPLNGSGEYITFSFPFGETIRQRYFSHAVYIVRRRKGQSRLSCPSRSRLRYLPDRTQPSLLAQMHEEGFQMGMNVTVPHALPAI